MSSFSKFVLAAATALTGFAASAHASADHSGFQARAVIASHEATPSLSAVVSHVRHHRHHRRHRVHPVRHVR